MEAVNMKNKFAEGVVHYIAFSNTDQYDHLVPNYIRIIYDVFENQGDIIFISNIKVAEGYTKEDLLRVFLKTFETLKGTLFITEPTNIGIPQKFDIADDVMSDNEKLLESLGFKNITWAYSDKVPHMLHCDMHKYVYMNDEGKAFVDDGAKKYKVFNS